MQAIRSTRYGEMLDLIACYSICNHGAKEKRPKRAYTFDEAMQLR